MKIAHAFGEILHHTGYLQKFIEACPAKALQYQANDNIEIPDITTIKRSAIDVVKCRLAHISGGLSPYGSEYIKQYVEGIIDGTVNPTLDGLEDKVTAEVSYAANAKKLFGSPSGLCGDGCVRACLAHLDETDRLSLKFRRPFRQ